MVRSRELRLRSMVLRSDLMPRVMIAMSGGIDSSVAAARLVRVGHEVAGVTMDLGIGQQQALRRARAVCRRLGIEHYVVDLAECFREQVIDYFCAEYAAGRTPNPCVRCNRLVKWDALLQTALRLGYDYLATGHYARKQWRAGRYRLWRGRDRSRDQSYVLYGLSQQQLARAMFPLGNSTKDEVRRLARAVGLQPGVIPESQDICFVKGDYRDFIRGRVAFAPGPIRAESGEIVGEHEGLPFYTIGQRRGLGIGGKLLFVIGKDVDENVLIVGPREALARRECALQQVNWVSVASPRVGKPLRVQVELRYRTRPIPATLEMTSGDTARLSLGPHDQAVTPGQSAVFYWGELLLGGGIIAE